MDCVVPQPYALGMPAPASGPTSWGRLTDLLNGFDGEELTLAFDDIEQIIGRPLPETARKHAAFWSNSSSYGRAWKSAGFTLSRRGMAAEHVRFVRAAPPTQATPVDASPATNDEPQAPPAPMPASQPPPDSAPDSAPESAPESPIRRAFADLRPTDLLPQLRGFVERAASAVSAGVRQWRDDSIAQPADQPNDQPAAAPQPVPAFGPDAPRVDPSPRPVRHEPPADLVLVGCVKTKRAVPAPARDLYVSASFDGGRMMAERSGAPWYVLSAKHGLVHPDEVIEPYDVYLRGMGSAYRAEWGHRVVARLRAEAGPLTGKTVVIYASAAYVEACRPLLEADGAHVVEPLLGMRQGERLAWYVQQRGDAAPMRPRPVNAPTSAPTATDLDTSRAVVAAILAYRTAHLDVRARASFADFTEADDLLFEDPFAFLIGVIFDEGIRAERAWEAPYRLRERLGTLDPFLMQQMPAEVAAAVAMPPMLHRFKPTIAEAVVAAAARVCDQYDGDASRIWAAGSSARDVANRLREFTRIGDKKANMAVELLVSCFGVQLAELHGSDIAYDVHVRRVFLRTGLTQRDSPRDIWEAARRGHPERPGELDLPTWHIGRQWCRPTAPDCARCPLGEVCPRLVSRTTF